MKDPEFDALLAASSVGASFDPPVIQVAGSRTWTDAAALDSYLSLLLTRFGRITLRHGDHWEGLDRMARRWAEARPDTVVHDPVPAMWKLYKSAAGPIRNRQMLRRQPAAIWHLAFVCRCKIPNCRRYDGPHFTHGVIDFIAEAKRLGCSPVIIPDRGLFEDALADAEVIE